MVSPADNSGNDQQEAVTRLQEQPAAVLTQIVTVRRQARMQVANSTNPIV